MVAAPSAGEAMPAIEPLLLDFRPLGPGVPETDLVLSSSPGSVEVLVPLTGTVRCLASIDPTYRAGTSILDDMTCLGRPIRRIDASADNRSGLGGVILCESRLKHAFYAEAEPATALLVRCRDSVLAGWPVSSASIDGWGQEERRVGEAG